MSLQSCVTCGHALAIVDGSCRHCNPSTTDFATHSWVSVKTLLLLSVLAVLVITFVYHVFVR